MTKSPDVDVAEEFIERNAERMFQLATRLTGSADLAAKATEDAIGRLVRDAAIAPPQATCVDRITARAAYEALRRRRGDDEELSLPDLLPPLDADGRHFAPLPDWSARLDEVIQHGPLCPLSTALDALPPAYRVALVLRDAEGFSLEEVAATLGTSARDAASRVHRARLFVRQRLLRQLASAV